MKLMDCKIPRAHDGSTKKVQTRAGWIAWSLGTRRLLLLTVGEMLAQSNTTNRHSYLFGSAQLLGESDQALPDEFGTEASDSDLSPSKSLALATSFKPELHFKDLYTLSLHHLTLFKRGAPFSEHSPLLYNLSQMPDWKKPHSGLRKMFLGEVIGKRVVVQGLWIGGWGWGPDMPSAITQDNKRQTEYGEVRGGESTKAPWATGR